MKYSIKLLLLFQFVLLIGCDQDSSIESNVSNDIIPKNMDTTFFAVNKLPNREWTLECQKGNLIDDIIEIYFTYDSTRGMYLTYSNLIQKSEWFDLRSDSIFYTYGNDSIRSAKVTKYNKDSIWVKDFLGCDDCLLRDSSNYLRQKEIG